MPSSSKFSGKVPKRGKTAPAARPPSPDGEVEVDRSREGFHF